MRCVVWSETTRGRRVWPTWSTWRTSCCSSSSWDLAVRGKRFCLSFTQCCSSVLRRKANWLPLHKVWNSDRSEEKHCRIVKKVYHITYKHKICKYWLEICDCRSNCLWTAIISTLFLSRPSLISFVQVKKRGLGLGAQAGPPISTAGLGSDRLDQPSQQKNIYIYMRWRTKRIRCYWALFCENM